MKVFDQRRIDGRYLELKIVFSQPMPVGYLRLKGRYSIVPKRLQKTLIRDYVLVLNSAGVSVSLVLQNTPHRLYHKDIVFCERELLRLVQKQLARHQQVSSYKSIRECLVDQLSALVSQDIKHANMERARIRGLSQLPESAHDTLPGLSQCILSMGGNIS